MSFTKITPFLRSATLLFGLVGLLLCGQSCDDQPILMSNSFISSDTYAEYDNTAEIELSTFRLDSVQTSGQNVVWVGKATKPVIGDIHSESYLRLAEPVNTDYPSNGYLWNNSHEVYDSVTITLRHTGAYEGDTMAPINIEVRRLATKITFAENETEFYNHRWFRDSTVIGDHSYTLRPHSHPRVRFRLNDEFGQDIVRFLKSVTKLETNVRTTYFDKFLGGIKITYGDKVEPHTLYAFRADSVCITLHSHLRGLEALKQHREFRMTSSQLQFNHVWNDNQDEAIATINNRYEQVTESESDLHSVIFEGLGYYTRVNIKDILSMQNITQDGHIVKANLKLYPERGSYDHRRIPSTFYAFEVNRGNVIQSQVCDSKGRACYATLVYNNLDLDEVYYSLDVTYYLNTILSNGLADDDGGIALTWGSGMSPTNYEFMVFNGHGKSQYRSELEIYYYYYDREDR